MLTKRNRVFNFKKGLAVLYLFLSILMVGALVPETVTALNDSPPTSLSSKEAAATKPNAPSNLVAQAISPTQVTLYWKDNSNNEDGWIIEWKEEKAAQWQSTKSVNPNIPNWGTSAGYFKPGTKYLFRVYAYNSAGRSNFFAEASATTPQVPTVEPPTPDPPITSQIPVTQAQWNSRSDAWFNQNMDNLRDIYFNISAPGLSGTSANRLGQLKEAYRQIVAQAKLRGPLLNTTVPALLTPSPFEGISTLTPRLCWWGVSAARSYELQVATDVTFAKLVVSRTGILNSYYDVPSGLQYNKTYYWRVRTVTAQGTSSWTKPGIFKTN